MSRDPLIRPRPNSMFADIKNGRRFMFPWFLRNNQLLLLPSCIWMNFIWKNSKKGKKWLWIWEGLGCWKEQETLKRDTTKLLHVLMLWLRMKMLGENAFIDNRKVFLELLFSVELYVEFMFQFSNLITIGDIHHKHIPMKTTPKRHKIKINYKNPRRSKNIIRSSASNTASQESETKRWERGEK